MTGWSPNARYPNPAIEILDPSFLKYRLFHASVERLATGRRWGEGPVWFGDGRYLLWSDIPNDRILRWDEATDSVGVYRQPSNKANGNTRDRQGRLVTCEHFGRRVTRTEYDGSITALIDDWQGKRLNSPNDVVVKSDGSIWFTDPPFGLTSHYEGRVTEPEIPARGYRIDPVGGEGSIVAEGIPGPNGLCFSPHERLLYLVASRAVPHREIRVFDVIGGGRLPTSDCSSKPAPAARPTACGATSTAISGVAGGVGTPELDEAMVFNPAGRAIGRIALPERCANVCFGGASRDRLFMACGHWLYALYVNARGVKGG